VAEIGNDWQMMSRCLEAQLK